MAHPPKLTAGSRAYADASAPDVKTLLAAARALATRARGKHGGRPGADAHGAGEPKLEDTKAAWRLTPPSRPRTTPCAWPCRGATHRALQSHLPPCTVGLLPEWGAGHDTDDLRGALRPVDRPRRPRGIPRRDRATAGELFAHLRVADT